MPTATELLRQGKKEEIWQKYCGFLDLDIGQYMSMQRMLLTEQLDKAAASELGARLLGGKKPGNMDEFRRRVPFTTYRDYADCLLARNEAMLPEKPYTWVHTSGRSGEYQYKWVPYTRRMYEVGGDAGLSCLILAGAHRRGQMVLREGMTFPYIIAPPPYLSGVLTQRVLEQFNFRCLPPVDKALEMDFQERLQAALSSALSEGLDFFFGVTSILIRISESFSSLGKGGGSMSGIKLTPKAMVRAAKALLKSAIKRRPLLPKDLWKVKGAMCGGMDTSIFKAKVVDSWGIIPLEAYASTEFGAIATQSWTREGLNFFPEAALWEFMLEKDYRAFLEDPSYIPDSCLMNEVKPDTEYVLVGTNLGGGALMRYIQGDLIKFISLEDKQGGIGLPQAAFVTRIDDVIDIGGFTRLTEKTVWRAVEESDISYEDWCVRKETQEGKPILRLYVEPRDGAAEASDIAAKVHESLKRIDDPYRDLEIITGIKPLAVTILSKGTFHRYLEERQAAGADLAHMKPPHINASDKVIENLIRMSAWRI